MTTTILTRKKLGHAPGSMDLVYLSGDIDKLTARLRKEPEKCEELLAASSELEAEARRLRRPEPIVKILLQRSDILRANGRYRDAIPVLEEAEQILGALRSYDLKIFIYAGLADARTHLQEWSAVLDICAKGIAQVEANRYDVDGQYLQSTYLRSRIGLYARGVQAAWEKKNWALMLEWAELSKCRSVLRRRSSVCSADEEEQQFEEQFGEVCRQIDKARAAGRDDQTQMLLSKRRTLWDLLLSQRIQTRTKASVGPQFSLRQVQDILAEDEAILYYYWIDDGRLLVVTIARDQIIPELRSVSSTERSDLKRFASYVLACDEKSSHSHFKTIRKFSSMLLPLEGQRLLAAKRRWLVSPHRLLHALPLHALMWEGEPVIRRFAISYIPNLTSLLVFYETPVPCVLAVGTCDFEVPGPPVPRLTDVEHEVTDIAQIYRERGIPVTVLPGTEARKGTLQTLATQGQLARFSCLHFATHGKNVPADTPMESYLLMRDALLDGLEIANWRLKADLVILSACCSGQRSIGGRYLDELPGDDLLGLQAAFFAAGARQLLCSLWPVESWVAHSIARRFHEELARQPPELALQITLNDYLDKASSGTRGEYYWAPFFLSRMGTSQPLSKE